MNADPALPSGRADTGAGVRRWLLRIAIFILLLAGILFDLATSLILNSLWAIIPAVLTVCVLVIRTTLEDRTLAEELDSYQDHAACVRYRLLPGVW